LAIVHSQAFCGEVLDQRAKHTLHRTPTCSVVWKATGKGVANGGRQARTMAPNSHAQSPTRCTAPTRQRCAGGHGLARGLQGFKWHHTVSSFWHGATLVDRMLPPAAPEVIVTWRGRQRAAKGSSGVHRLPETIMARQAIKITCVEIRTAKTRVKKSNGSKVIGASCLMTTIGALGFRKVD